LSQKIRLIKKLAQPLPPTPSGASALLVRLTPSCSSQR
jgi:hypothetical protein